jgi:hypothetical protein
LQADTPPREFMPAIVQAIFAHRNALRAFHQGNIDLCGIAHNQATITTLSCRNYLLE